MTLTALNVQQVPQPKHRYANALRCIGQSVESLELKALEVKTHGENYIVQLWNKGISISMDAEQHYTVEDIKELEIKGRGRVKKFPAPPDLLSLSQVLRLAGSYVDRMRGRLVRVSWQDQSDKIQSVTIQFEPSTAGRSELTRTIEELCIHVYKQKKRISASSDKAQHRNFVSAAGGN